MIPEEKIAEIRQSARISEFVSPHVALKRKGRTLMGLCPFHNEKTASFSVSDEGGFFHCFGCGAGGNVFKFLMQIENLTFPESVHKVAERYNISVPEQEQRGSDQREACFAANASAARYFHRFLLESPHAEPARAYLRERGVSDEAVETFSVGAAPVSGTGLVQWFEREGVASAVARKLGLLGERGARLFDRFRSRLMFPIRDPQGRVIGFGGRLLGQEDAPKYLNSPESEVYRKSRALYGFYEGRSALRQVETVILVEGYLDVIALHEAGICNAVATCGTALTTDQARMIRRVAPEVVTLFDGDGAGSRAASRSFPIFIESGLWAKAAALPAGEDPDSYVRARGAEAIEGIVREARPLAEAYAKSLVGGAAAGDAGLAKVGAELAALLAKIEDPFEYDLLVRKAALWTGISEAVLRRQGARGGRPAPAAPTRLKGGAPGPEELLVTVMLADENAVARVDESAIINSMEGSIWKELAHDMIERVRGARGIDPGETIERLPEDFRNRVAARLVDDAFGEESMRERILDDCIKGIERLARRRHNESVLNELRKREELGVELAPAEELANWRPRSSS